MIVAVEHFLPRGRFEAFDVDFTLSNSSTVLTLIGAEDFNSDESFARVFGGLAPSMPRS